MTVSGKILIVDDEPAVIETYRDLLGDQGYSVITAKTTKEAVECFSDPDLGVILLDQKLQGSKGPDSGLDLIAIAREVCPAAKVIIATAYPDPHAIERAFAEGVYDYLEKNERLAAHLRAKVRNAMEVWRERRMAALKVDAREAEIHAKWQAVLTETDRHVKGRVLEELLLLLFRSIAGFESATTNRRNEIEEIDVVIQNSSADPFWHHTGAYLLVECKNWSSTVGVPELDRFWNKVDRRYGHSRLGFLIALNGYARTLQTEQLTRRSGQSLVVLLKREDLDELVHSDDRCATLKRFHERAVVVAPEVAK